MTICVIPSIFPNDFNRNGGIFIYNQCLALKKKGDKVYVLDVSEFNYRKWSDSKLFKIEKKERDGIIVYSKHVRGLLTSKLPRLYLWITKKALLKIFKLYISEQGLPDVIYAHFTFPSGINALYISETFKIPLVVQEHHSLFLQPHINSLILKKAKEVIIKASSFFCVSDHLVKNMQVKCQVNKRIQVIPNMINPIFQYANTDISDNVFTFISVGTMSNSKGMDKLIEGFCHAFTVDEAVRLFLVGTGKHLSRYEKIVSKLHRNEQIVFLGRVSQVDLSKLFHNCHCFVLLSMYETFGIAYREAMVSGLPVISWENQGIRIGWNSNYGMIVNKNEDIPIVLKSMVKCYCSYDTFNISREILSRYSEEVVLNKIIHELNKALIIAKS